MEIFNEQDQMTPNKHEALVRQIAEEMTHAAGFVRIPGYKPWQDQVKRRIPEARVAVKHMANSFESGWAMMNKDGHGTIMELRHHQANIGLIPTPDQEAGKP